MYVQPHDFPSTVWANSLAIVPKTYSDGPSDELNARMDQDLGGFRVPVIVSPEQSYLEETTQGRESPSPPSPLPYDAPYSSRARSTERRSSSRPPRADASPARRDGVAPLTPQRKGASSTQSRRGLELKEVDPPLEERRRRPRSASSRRSASSSSTRHVRNVSNAGDDSANNSFDGSFASNPDEVIEDLNTLSDFLRERREAKRAQRQERMQQQREPRSQLRR